MGDILDILSLVYNVGKWAFVQFNAMQENSGEAQELAGRILRLSGVAHSLRTQLQSNSKKLSPNIPSHLMHIEAFFAQLEAMLQAHNAKHTYSAGFLSKCRALFANVKTFFGAERWRDQLIGANGRLTQVLGDLEQAIVAENLMVSIDIRAVVEGIAEKVSENHKAVLDVKGALQQQHQLLLQGSKGISRIEVVQQQLLQQEQQLHNQILQQLQQLPQYKDVQRIQTLQQQLLQQQQQNHEQVLQRLQQLDLQQEHADGSQLQEMIHELHHMMEQQKQQVSAPLALSNVTELKGMMQDVLRKLQLRSSAASLGAAAPASSRTPVFSFKDIKIVNRIGEGGNSDVYLAQCHFFPGHVVYKQCMP